MTTTLQILRKGLERLQRRGGWTKGYFARNERGTRVPAMSAEAVCWCAIGAADNDEPCTRELQCTLNTKKTGEALAQWNDRQRDKRPVVRLYQRTIARLEAANGEG